ncbi:hypothetical protein [Sporichthya polymorpha]|uniref:hypothetical protein n=1 Tax=Sporichthya polymorpha TaxID=35751 RepID=UPI000360428F|nr:hypothetical protein [Sporichthya polymorpha]
MSEQRPGLDREPDPEEYAAALDRLLDGIEGTAPADAAVRADTDSIARALGLIGGALAAEEGGTPAATPLPPAAAGGTVVAMSSWRSKLNPRVLAAAASLVVVLGVGVPLAVNSTGGSGSNDSTTALGVPESAADRAAGAPAAPAPADAFAADPGGDLKAEALSDDAGAGTNAAVPGTTSGSAGGVAAAEQAPPPMAADAPPAPAAAKTANDAARQAATPQFADAVACARGIFTGTITAVQPAPDGAHYDVTVLVEEWIAPTSGPVSVTHRVFGSTANSPGEDETVRVGLRRLFVVAASESERIYSFRPKDWAATKQRIAAIRAERSGQSC